MVSADDSTQASSGDDGPRSFASSESAPVATETIRIKADYPQKYTVKQGDTLWGIASKFLKDPWFWPEIWQRNPQVKNPHLIYPGDILTLIYVDGAPQIQLTRPITQTIITETAEGKEEAVVRTETMDTTRSGLKVVKLSPGVRRTSREEQIPSIPSDAIRQFLARPRVVTLDVIEEAPYIVASDEAHLILGTDNRVYIRGELDKERVRYSIYHRGDEFRDPDSNDILGYEIIYSGEVRIDVYGNPATGIITEGTREILIGDFLMTTDTSEITHLYYPKLPSQDVDAQIISLFDAISGVASYQIVVINRGMDDGMEVGHILATYYRGGAALDKYMSRKTVERGKEKHLKITLPDERSGLMMLFRVFDKVSYGLILESSRSIRKNDVVRKPH
ncbi:MAG: LysM peptidoglycan-binding domain-containing protein [Gammaproteobacteria bacterium]|nr:LysM peptidoglycan-binding domain-containing protein [Gammaproteobacteria bacterium]